MSGEHYLPRCLGKFRGYEQLRDRVCNICNNRFSLLDEQVCCSGPEAIFRERFNVEGYRHHRRRSPFQKGSAGARPVELKGTIESEGTEVDLYYHRQTGVARRRRQIIFSTDIGEVSIQITDDMTEPEHLDEKLIKRGVKTLAGPVQTIFAPGEQDWILHLLSGYKDAMIGEPEMIEMPEGVLVNVYADARPTHLYFRGLAKIGFHYFVKHMPEFHGSEDCFAGIRYFITDGNKEDVYRFTAGWVNHFTVDDVQARPSPAGYYHRLEAQADCRQLISRLQFFIGPGFRLPVHTIYLGPSPLLVDYTRRCAHSFIYSDGRRQDGYDGEMREARLH
jgi:hypothetical protein